jgi:hypothetical protein
MNVAARTWPWWILPAILLTAVAVNAWDYSVLVPRQDVRIATHRDIVAGAAVPSAQRRILVPLALEPFIGVMREFMPPDKAITRSYAMLHLFSLAGVLGAVYRYAALWFSRDQALVGALIVGSTLRLSLRQGEYWDQTPIPLSSVFVPWSILDGVFIGFGLVSLYQRRARWFIALTALASLNSEAAVLLPAAAAANAAHAGWRLVTASTITWALITLALYMATGEHWPPLTWNENVRHLAATAVNLALFMGAAILIAVAGWRHAPSFARRSLAASAAFLAAFAAFGYWWDMRVLIPMYPLLVPLVLSAVWRPGPASR